MPYLGRSFALDSYQDVGFLTLFSLAAGPGVCGSAGWDWEGPALSLAKRFVLPPCLPSTPLSGNVCRSQRQVLWLCLQYGGDVSVRNARLAKWASTACWCAMKRFPSCLALCSNVFCFPEPRTYPQHQMWGAAVCTCAMWWASSIPPVPAASLEGSRLLKRSAGYLCIAGVKSCPL